ncbi:MAG: DUF1329 domain-containing protein [Desulfobacterales bacterium]|nr:DUF1329 domain-containing protein [Desulfobacterales bacterium]
MKRIISVSILAIFFVGSLLQPVFADAEWKAKQDALMEKHGLKVGDVYDGSNVDNIKQLLPPAIVNWVKKDGWKIPIGELSYDFGMDQRWFDKWEKANAGKFAVGDRGEVIEKATGTFPKKMQGLTYPLSDVDFNNPVKAGYQLLHNTFSTSSTTYNYKSAFCTNWVGEGGWERDYGGSLSYLYYTGPGSSKPNPNLYKNTSVIYMGFPFDIQGTVNMGWKYLDGSPSKGFVYIPSIRRVKRTSPANRSAPAMGSDFCNDDAMGFTGDPESMELKLIGQDDYLMSMAKRSAKNRINMIKNPDGSYSTPVGHAPITAGFLDMDNAPADVVPWALTNLVWIPRAGYQLEMNPKDPYYSYGRQILYMDQNSYAISYKVVYDRSGQYWKTVMVNYTGKEIAGDISTKSTVYLVVDDKTHHSSICPADGTFMGRDMPVIYDSSKIKSNMFNPQYISGMSR